VADAPSQRLVTEAELRELERRQMAFEQKARDQFKALARRDQHHDEMLEANRQLLLKLEDIHRRLERPRSPQFEAADWYRFGALLAAIIAGLTAHAEITKPMHREKQAEVIESPALPVETPVVPAEAPVDVP
jgi:CHASE1-domain containing sensor protein